MRDAAAKREIRALYVLSLVGTLAVLAAVFYLTAQSGTDTLKTQALAEQYFPALFPKHAHCRTWLALHLNSARRLAHIYEFFALGLAVTVLVRTRQKRSERGSRRVVPVTGYALSALLCSLCSVLDQTHKIFVQYRHFDVLDLRLDAIGYLTAVGMVYSVHLLSVLLQRARSLALLHAVLLIPAENG